MPFVVHTRESRFDKRIFSKFEHCGMEFTVRAIIIIIIMNTLAEAAPFTIHRHNPVRGMYMHMNA